jgi:hypothetical protein
VFTTGTDKDPVAVLLEVTLGVATPEDDVGLLFPLTKTNAHKSGLSGLGAGVCAPRLT